MNPTIDAQVAQTFFAKAAQVGQNDIMINLRYKVLDDHPDWVNPTDFLSGSDREICLHDPDGVIPGDKLLLEVVRQYWLYDIEGL